MARLKQSKVSGVPRRRVLVVDDDAEFAQSTARLLTGEGHEVSVLTDPSLTLQRMKEWHPSVLLLDYYMGRMTGDQVVRSIRESDRLTQVVLVTGYASEHPARRLLAELDIQSFHDKADGPERLLVTLDGVLKHHAALAALEKHRQILRSIAAASPDLSSQRQTPALVDSSLRVLRRLMDGDGARHAVGLLPGEFDGFWALRNADSTTTFVTGAGGLVPAAGPELLPQGLRASFEAAWSCAAPSLLRLPGNDGLETFLVVPVRLASGEQIRMVLRGELPEDALPACELLGQQIAQTWENIRLFERATHDGLTSMYNRSYGLQRVGEMLHLMERAKDQPASVLMIDIDNFKDINDRLGHAGGDKVLQEVADRIRSSCRDSDILMRYGGEEFAIGLPMTDLPVARDVAERLRRNIAASAVTFDRQALPLTISVGAARARPGERVDELVRRADAALYRAKREGRNRVCLDLGHDPGPEAGG